MLGGRQRSNKDGLKPVESLGSSLYVCMQELEKQLGLNLSRHIKKRVNASFFRGNGKLEGFSNPFFHARFAKSTNISTFVAKLEGQSHLFHRLRASVLGNSKKSGNFRVCRNFINGDWTVDNMSVLEKSPEPCMPRVYVSSDREQQVDHEIKSIPCTEAQRPPQIMKLALLAVRAESMQKT